MTTPLDFPLTPFAEEVRKQQTLEELVEAALKENLKQQRREIPEEVADVI